jgi:endonuclease/exonuclease/phosphatase (EEP) superfamily protein YafD
MFTAVFWNIGGKSPRDGIVRLIAGLQREHDADVVALAECSDGVIGSVLRALNPRGAPSFTMLPITSRVQVIIRGTITRAEELDRHAYYSILKLTRGSEPTLLLAPVHMVSRLEKEAPHIDRELEQFASAIRSAEDRSGHNRTIVIGDLNAHPFSDGVAGAVGLNGVMSSAVATRHERKASHRVYPFFFNPMWKFFGDNTTAPTGTYYREPGGDHTGYYWHMFDQVLIRAPLLPFYQHDSACIVTGVAGQSLAGSEWTPDPVLGSDHFPIRIRLTC